MANYDLTVSFADAYQRRGTKRFVLDAVDHITAVTNATTFTDALAALMEADILKFSVALITDYTDSVVAGANIDESITISCDLGGGKRAALKIPTPINSVINGDGTVDLTDALITTLETEYTAGKVLISDGETVLDFLTGKLDK